MDGKESEALGSKMEIPHAIGTFQDYPLLQLKSDAELEEVIQSCHSQLREQQLGEIEDIFPCTPMQEGMLAASLRASHLYQARSTKELKAKYGTAHIDMSTLQRGWDEVVERHQVLRTVFVQTRLGKRSFLQVVLRCSTSTTMTPISVVNYETESQLMDDDEMPFPEFHMPQQHLRLYRIAEGGRLFCRFYLHHATCDAFSASLFFRDLVQALDGTLTYQAPPQQYKAFVNYLGEQDHQASLSFWNHLLCGTSACKFPSFSGGSLSEPKILQRRVVWTAIRTTAIRNVCKKIGISPASFFRSIWALVLRCYTASDDVCFGAISSGRSIPLTGSMSIVGAMIANVTCRAQMPVSMTIVTLLKTMMDRYGKSLPFQHCSLAEIMHNAGLVGEPLFNTIVNFMAGHPKEDVLESALYAFEHVEFYDPTDYDILLEILDDTTNMSMSFKSWQSFMREDEADCIIATFTQAIASVLEDPDQTIGDLSLFSPEDTSRMLSWSKCQLQPIYSTIHEQVSHQAALSPGKVAVYSTSLSLTYRDIDSLSDRLADILVESGVGKGSMVPFCMEKSVWAPVAMLGALKAGAAFVPLDPAHPTARLEWFIDEIGADLILCSYDTLGKVQGLYQVGSKSQNRLKVMLVEDVMSRTSSPTLLRPSVDPSDMAYILFTSGSTGNPKGVVVSHQAACGSMAQCATTFQIHSGSRVLQFSAYTWDAIVCEIFSTLDCGGTIFVPNEVERMDELAEFIEKLKLNWLFLTPTVLRLVRAEQLNQKLTIVTIGELLGQDLIEKWHDRALLINSYGPTETCVACTAGVVKKGTSGQLIGKSFGSRAWVVLPEDHNRLSPLGSIGELLIEGPNLAQGYFKDKQKTAMSFLSKPPQWAARFGLEASYRFYKTGDLVRQNIDDGSLMFVARKDTQIKINGQRVELGEVEHHLLNSGFTSIRDAVAMVPKDGPWKNKLVAVLSLPRHGTSTKEKMIPLISPSFHNEVAKEIFQARRRLEDSLPAYMIPNFWMPLTELPVLYSGKIDRSEVSRWLCRPDEKTKEHIQAWMASIGTLDEDQKQPTTPAQKELQRIWADVLHLPQVKVSVDKSFHNLGGDSILAITVATQSRAAGIPVTVRDLLRRKTIEELASSAEIEAPWMQEQNPKQPFKVSPTQEFYLATCQDQLSHPALLINLRRPVESDTILAAVNILVGRHPMLLARFQQDGEEHCKWTQTLDNDVKDSWNSPVHHLDSAEEIEMVYASSQKNVATQPGPVFSVDLISIQGKFPFNCILLTASALIIDAQSFQIIFEDLEDILQTGAPLQPASMPFRDWIDQQAKATEGAMSTEVTPDYWGLEAGYQNDLAVASFSMSPEEKEALITSCNRALRTEPTDLIIAAVLEAFEHVFTDRMLPIAFSEQDGRQPLDTDTNIGRTVGLFKKIFPITLKPADTAMQSREPGSSSLKETIMKVKDSRKMNERTTWSIEALSSDHKPIEVFFRSLKISQMFGGKGTMLQAKILPELRHTTSTAVFEFSPSLEQDSLVINLSYPNCISLHDKISKWMYHCKLSLQAILSLTKTLDPQPTLQDYPLLELASYLDLDKVTKSCQLQLGLQRLGEIEDIYPCSPMQEGILLAQAKTSLSIYDQRLIWKIQDHDVDLGKLQNAWQSLIDGHTMLRTVFIEYPLKEHHAAQIVLRHVTANVSRMKCKDLTEFQKILALRLESQNRVLHDFVICNTQNGDIYCALSFNHILGDMISVQILARELQLAYEGSLESVNLPSYAGFISYLKRQEWREVYQYWETTLANVEVCSFQKLANIDHGNLHPESSSRSKLSFDMTTGQISQLRRLGTEFGISTATLSNTIWALMLRTFLGREDVCFGYLAWGRDIDLPGVQTMLGPLVTLLVCRVNIDPTMHLLDLARVVQENYLQSLPAQHYSLAEVYHLLGLQGEQLFNTVVNVVPRISAKSGKQSSNQSLDMELVSIINPSEFDISLDVIYSNSEAKVELNYRVGYLSESLASRMIATVSRILKALLETPKLKVCQLKLCDELQQQSMSTWEPSDDIESHTCLHETIEQTTRETPDAEAVCAHDGNFSYRDVWTLSNQLAHSLVARGVGPNVCVPFCFEKSKWAVVAIMGILKAGGCCVPLDPSYPEVRLKYMVDLTESFITLVSEECAGLVTYHASDSLVVSASFFTSAKNTNAPPVTGVRASDPSYIIFSSGTTGEPKASVLEHRSIQAYSRILPNHLHFGRHSRVLHFASYVFDVSIEEVVCTLMFGGCVCIPHEHERLNNLAGAMERMRVNWTNLTPTVIRTFTPAEVPHLKTLVAGGELLEDDLISLWSTTVNMFNVLGPSECSIFVVSSKKLGPGDSGTNIGRGFKCRIWIVDPKNHHMLSPLGAIGEMLVEGWQVGRGYYKDPEKTAAAFIKDPEWALKSSSSSGRRFFKSGDLARFDQCGNLVCLGRKDQQVKIRGQRVELAEIEFHLARHPAIDSAVAVFPSKGWSKASLVAIVVLHASKDATPNKEPLSIYMEALGPYTSTELAEVSASLQVTLPRYMIPSTIIPVYSFPLTPGGKLNRRAIQHWLEMMDRESSEILRSGAESADVPSTELEEQIQAIWSQALELPIRFIGVNVSFLSLGGDSISAVKAASLSRASGHGLTVQALLQRKTIAELALSSKADVKKTVQREETLDRAFKLSPTQTLQLPTKQDQFAHSLLLSISHTPEVDVILAAIQLLVKRHSMLRARFWKDSDGEWKQRLVADGPQSWIWGTHQLDTFEEIQKVWASNQINAMCHDGPVFSAEFIHLVNGADYILFIASRLVIDMESWRIIFEDLVQILQTDGILLQPPSLSYQAWVHQSPANSEVASSRDLDEVSKFWGPEAFDGSELQAGFSMSEEETKSLMNSCNNAFRTTSIELIMAAMLDAFELVFNNRHLPETFVEGVGRKYPNLDVARTVGLFTHIYPVTVQRPEPALEQHGSSQTRLIEMIKMVKDGCRSNVNTTASRREPLEILFRTFNDLQRLVGDKPTLHVVPMPPRSTTSDTLQRMVVLEVSAMWKQGRLAIGVNYPARTPEQEQITNWIRKSQDLIRSVIHLTEAMEPEATLYDYPLLQLSSYAALDEVINSCRLQLGVYKLEEIEDIYPCSPMQEGMLLAQSKSTNLYNSHIVWKVKNPSDKVDTDNIRQAWQAIVQRHQILRTRFIEATGATGTFLQVVLSEASNIRCLEVVSPDDIRNTTCDSPFTLFQTVTGDTYIRLALNHAIYDGGSSAILARELILKLNGSPLPRSVPLYRDFIAYLVDQQPQSVARYWETQLVGVSACKFPVLRPADFTKSTYDRKQASLPADHVLSIRKLCREANVTPSTFFRAVWMTILKSFTGSDDTCFGTVASGRDVPVSAAQDIMGPMITLMVCRTQVDSSTSFLEVLKSMQESYLSDLPFQHVSLAEIYHGLGLRGGEQLFNTIVNFLGRGAGVKPDYDESWTVLEEVSGGGSVEYDITFTIEETSTTMLLSLDYWSSCLSVELAGSVVATICQAITSILEAPKQKISHINLFNQADASTMKDWYKSEINSPVADTIHGRVERQAILQPTKLAVCSTILNFTYKELNDFASRLAWRLMSLGVGPGRIVPFLMEKSVWPVVAVLGVLKTGAAFLPLDPLHPPNRLGFFVDETEAKVLLCSRSSYEKAQSINGHELNVVVVEDAATTMTPSLSSLPQINPSETAYIMFTSGSTGTPKGVVVSHQAACGSLVECAKAFQLNNHSRALQFSAYTWDAMICEIFATLNCGATVFVPDEAERVDGLVDYIKKENLNWLFLTPTVLRLIPPERFESQQLTIVTIGESLGWDLMECWYDKAVLINAYGPTETCVACTAGVIRSVNKTLSNEIGKTFGCRAWVTVPEYPNRLSPIGSVGELVIEGPNLANGYYKDVRRTAQLFIDRPQWASETSHRFYKTGDLVRQNMDGSLIFMGRKDTQVKINGQRVELLEVENHLLGLEGIEHAVALVPREGLLKGKLVAVFSVSRSHTYKTMIEDSAWEQSQIPLVISSLRSNMAHEVAQFRKHIEDTLPIYMVPTVWIPFTHLPLLPSGKTNRSQIYQWLNKDDAPSWAISDSALGQLQPATPAEFQLQRIWADVLNLPMTQVGTDRSFLSLGGDSISAMKAAWRSRADSFAVTITVQNLLRRKTIMELASMAGVEAPPLAVSVKNPSTEAKVLQTFPLLQLTSHTALDEITKSCCSQLGIQPADIEDIYPCSPMQQGILIAEARVGSSKVYDQRLTIKISSPITDPRQTAFKLQNAWQDLVDRHAILRTAFIESPLQGHHFIQVVLHDFSANVTQLEMEQHHFLDSSKAPQLAVHKVPHHLTICTTQNDVYCRLDFNHALSDAASVQIMLHELCLAYDGHLEPSAPSYASFISHLAGQDSREVQLYWQNLLSGVEACTMPNQGNNDEHHLPGARESLKLKPHQVSQLYQICSENELTVGTLSNTLWAVVLSLFLGREDVCFGYLASGRDINVEGVQNMLGPVVTLLVCCANVSYNGTQSLLDLARTIQDGYLESLPAQHYSLAEVYHDLGMQGGCLFNTVVNVLYSGTSAKESSNQAFSISLVDAATPSEFDISLDVAYSDSEITISLNYSSECLSKALASSMMTTISRILESLLANLTMNIGQFEVCSELQQESLSDASDSIIPQMCLHEIIKQQALNHPRAQVVCAHDGDFSYEELWSLTEQLSHHLINLGVKPNTYVPFCFEKSKWSIVAILAILNAGGCCVPLEPTYPKSRLEYMVNLVDTTIVLTSSQHFDLARHMVANPLVVDQAYFDAHSQDVKVSPLTSVQPNDAAYIIFTSGTTGQPKAVVIEHQSIEAFLRVLGTSINLNQQSRVLQFTSFVFDVSIEEILGTLAHGGCLCIPSDGERLDDLASAMERFHVNWADLTPTVLRTLTPASVPHLKTVVSGGEAVGDDLVKTWASLPGIDMFQCYGPSECTVSATFTDKIGGNDRGSNIGKGRACRIWIANPTNHHQLSPIGAVGEILIEGRQVAREYLKSPKQTATFFITNPAWSKTSSVNRKMYKTGDLARFDEDGTLVYLGRKDQQIKIRGQRVELTEIEFHVGAHYEVCFAVVVVPRQGSMKGLLVAIVVLKTTLEFPDTDERRIVISNDAFRSCALMDLSTSLEQTLPRHMRPSVIIPILSLPLLVSGKINRRALNQWLENLDQETSDLLLGGYVTEATDLPSNDIESRIRDIFSQVLNRSLGTTGVNSSFFSLGGDSILAMQMSSRLREEDMKISVQEIFEQKTIKKLAASAKQNSSSRMASLTRGTHLGLETDIRTAFLNNFEEHYGPSHIEDAFSCSNIQETILAAQILEPQAWTAVMHFKVELPVPADLDVLENAWSKVVTHHGILRTVFIPVLHDNVWRHGQVVLNYTKPSVLKQKLSDAEASILDLRPMTLPQHLPPHHLAIMQTFSGKTVIRLQISHALYDTTALSILLRDLRLAFDGANLASTTPYRGYVVKTGVLEEDSAVSHWKPLLEGYQAKAIKFAKTSNYPNTSFCTMRKVEADIASITKIQKYCQEQSTTISNLFQTVWAICLRDIASDDDVCFGNMISGRELAGSEFGSVVGPCVNVLPCRVRFNATTTIQDLQRSLQKDLFAALSHQYCSLEMIRQSSGLEDRPLFETYLNVRRGRHEADDCASGLDLHHVDSYMFEQYQVVVYVNDLDDEGVKISLSYRSPFIPDERANELLDLIQHVMNAVVGGPLTRLAISA